MAHLVAISGPATGKRFELAKESVLGRSFNSDVYVGDLNVSRRHARIITTDDGSFIVEDLGSGNGTFVNDQQITRHTLANRDVIRIGGTSLRYEEAARKDRWGGAEVQTVIADLMDLAPMSGVKTPQPMPGGAAAPAVTAAQPSEAPPELSDLGEGRAVKMLQAMYAVADAIGEELDLDKLLAKVLEHLFVVFPQAERGFVLLKNEASGQLVPEAVRQRAQTGGLSYSQTMVDQVMSGGQGVIQGLKLSEVDAQPSGANAEQPAPKIGSPLICRGEAVGTVHLEGRVGASRFSPDDLALLSAIARQAALAIANARTGRALMDQQRMETDLQLARKIQQSFLPHRLPQVPGLRFETHYLPALHVGGDFYDIIELGPNRIGIMVGDISGKGVSAALLMAKVSSDIRLFSRLSGEPGEILTNANRTLIESEQDAMFATVIYTALDLEARTFTVANAGHQPPMVCSTRFEGISELDDATSVALGMVPEMVYAQEVYELVPGDVALLYTDGINEAHNRQNQEYGMQRLRNAVVGGPIEPSQVLQRLVADIRRFVGNTPQFDDQTMVAFGLVEG